MGRFVIAAFRPKPGKTSALVLVVRKHLDVLRAESLVSERPSYVMQAADGTVVEVFEWLSAQAIAEAHHNPRVLALWDEFAAACDYVPLASLAETQKPFAEFDALSL
ncbi:MAG: hypothetical protein ABSF50_16660 [Burkholderiaceae bacterium]|jgi:hypothetical protein